MLLSKIVLSSEKFPVLKIILHDLKLYNMTGELFSVIMSKILKIMWKILFLLNYSVVYVDQCSL